MYQSASYRTLLASWQVWLLVPHSYLQIFCKYSVVSGEVLRRILIMPCLWMWSTDQWINGIVWHYQVEYCGGISITDWALAKRLSITLVLNRECRVFGIQCPSMMDDQSRSRREHSFRLGLFHMYTQNICNIINSPPTAPKSSNLNSNCVGDLGYVIKN